MNTTQIRDRSDFAIVVPSFLDEYGLDPMEYRLYSHIVRRAGKDGCFESIPNMAKICLMNEKTVRKALRILIAAGLIKIIQERKGKTSIYEITHSSEWIDSQQLKVIRQQIVTKKVEKNLVDGVDSGTKSGTTELGTSTKSGRGSGTKSGRGSGTKSGRGVVPNQVDEVFPIKEVPIKESQLREDPPTPKIELNASDETFSLTPQPQHEISQQQILSNQNEEPEQPTPKYSTSLSNSESFHQNDKLSCGSIVPESFDNHEKLNIVELSAVANQELSSGEVAKLQKYQQLEADGIKLKQPELRDWAALEIAPYVKTYRKSGFILTGGNDVSSEFAIYVAKQNCRKGQEPSIALGFNVINKCETDPRQWQKLVAWVREWQHHRHTGERANVASVVNHQEQLNRIRQAANTKFEL